MVVDMSSSTLFKRTPLFLAISTLVSISSYSHALEEGSQQLPTIKVQASQDSDASEKTKAYTIKSSSSATKLDIEAKEIPQTINVVTRQQIEDFGLTSSRDVLNNTPGVTVNSLETERSVYMARGFEISNILVDGVGFPSGEWNYNDTNPDSYFYDRIEVIKGADALTNAFGDPSATINYIRKRPTKEFQANAGLSYGSWDTQRYEADASGSLSPNGAVRGRVSGFQQTGDSNLDRYSSEKNGIAGILEADLGDNTLLTIGASQEKNKPNANNWGALPLMDSTGKQISYDRSYNPNPDWTYWDNTSRNAFFELKQKLSETWSANLSYNYNEKNRKSQLLYYYGYPNADGSGISLTPSGFLENNKLHTADLNLQGKFDLFNQEHEAIIGYSFSNSHQNDHAKNGTLHDSNINYTDNVPYTTDWASWTPNNVTWSDFSQTADYTQRNQSVYAATRLHLNDDLKVTLGANYVKAKSEGISYDAPMVYDESKVSPYAGITYNFTPEYTGYMSYTSIFRPQTAVDEKTGKVADPIEGKSYEVGFKSSWLDNKLTGTLAVFRTEESNYPLRPTDSHPLNRTSAISDLRSQGVEVGLAGQLTDQVNVSLGYTQFSLQDLKNGGAARTYNPTQSFNLLTTYSPAQLPKLKVGAGLKWQSKITRFDPSYNTYLKQSDYALLNLMASYDISPNLSIQANANNVTDKKYLNSFTDGQAFYGAPANYTIAFRFKY
ncbi:MULTISPECIES: TonB-dependent siderophore receptor [Acinetobacter]|uniref:TonB-dependent siderophore receptor n=1 Tax=Acinetobacter TaxID=469 RepID=UPI00051C1A6C|nr:MULTISPECIES: TonB-dependent siderophore receptor [Acinetobacter]MCH7381278.1 TonB-dependent siderophore receptor [Acinetobacter higginsii]MCJ0827507.1 TonB-dependent siderophore receptor [Acinetobacter sp. NIPH1876]